MTDQHGPVDGGGTEGSRMSEQGTCPICGRAGDCCAERDRYWEALQEIASALGRPGDPAWREAMEALGLDADAAERAWHD